MKKKLSKTELIALTNSREIRKLRDDIRAMRGEMDALGEMIVETHNTLIDIAYLLAPVIYDVRTRGKFRPKSVRRVADLIRKNERGDMTKLEQAFWTGEEVE